MKKILISLLCVILAFSTTACTKRSELKESEDTPEVESTMPEGECIFNSEDTVDVITSSAREHGMSEKNTLCYKSNNYYKIDTTRLSSQFELQEMYEDAISDIVANGNLLQADNTFFFVESVILNEDGYFIIYIDYEYRFDNK